MSFALTFQPLPTLRGLDRRGVYVGHVWLGTVERGVVTARFTTPSGRSRLFLVEDLDSRLAALGRKLVARHRPDLGAVVEAPYSASPTRKAAGL